MSTAPSHPRAGLDPFLPEQLESFESDRAVDRETDQPAGVALHDDFHTADDDLGEDYAAYRSLSPAAVASLVLGVASFLAFLDWWLVVVPTSGLALGVFALRRIAGRSDELTGRIPAAIGVALSSIGLLGGQAALWYERLTEVPPGHLRISYSELQPPERSIVPIPDTVHEFDGERVFIKGYVLAGTRKEGIRTFILVRDKDDCCFGGDPKLTDRILVHLKPGHTFSYTDRLQKLAGRFHLRPGQAVDVSGGVVYQLDDAEIL